MKRWVWAGFALMGLAACDGGGVEDAMSFDEKARASAAMAERVAGLPISSADELPTTGTATFDGYAAIALDTKRETALMGDLVMEADFEHATLSGRIDDVTGRLDGGPARSLDGHLTVSDGYAGPITTGGAGPDGPLDPVGYGGFAGDLSGRLTGGGDVLRMDGLVRGQFHGNGGAALSGDSGGGETDFSLNGSDVGGLVTIVGERR